MSDPKHVEDLKIWLREFKHDTQAAIAITDLWLENDDNQARVILKAFKIGVEQGKRLCADANLRGGH